MKRYTIFLMLAACVVAIQACAPKAVIPSAARLSEKEYLQAIKTERKARNEKHLEVLAKQNGYYLPPDQRNLPIKEQRKIKAQNKKLSARMVDSLLDIQRFRIQITSGFVSREGDSNRTKFWGGRYNKLIIDTTELNSRISADFLFQSYDFGYQIKSRTAGKTEVIIKAPAKGAYTLLMTVRSNGEVEIYGTSIVDKYYNLPRVATGMFYGYIQPIEEDFNP